MKTSRSAREFRLARRVLVGGVNSPVRTFRAVGGTPLFIRRGAGAVLVDADGNRYVDFCLSWGALALGHAHPRVVKAVARQAALGTSYGAPTRLETELALRLRASFPSCERFRFTSSGTEAVMTAVRLARGATGRTLIVKFEGCYHGHSDGLLAKGGSGLATLGHPASLGVPAPFARETLVLPYNDAAALADAFRRHGRRVAAVLIEPVAGNMGMVPAQAGFLRLLRRLTRRSGALLVFDEVITGFRVHRGGAQALTGVRPDLTTLGKVIGGGLPVGAVGGPGRLMRFLAPEGAVYQAGTLSGNPLSMAAGLETLRLLGRPGVFEALARRTRAFARDLRKVLRAGGIPAVTPAAGSMFGIFFQDAAPLGFSGIAPGHPPLYRAFFRHMLRQGVYLPPSPYEAMFLSLAHGKKHLDQALEAAGTFTVR